MTNEIAIVVVAAIGVLGTLAASFVAPFFQRKHERWKAAREDRSLLRDKAEELFDELDQFVASYQDASVAALAKMQNPETETRRVPDLGKVRSIAAIYFPSTMELIANFEKQNLELLKTVVDEARAALGAGDDGVDTLKGLPMVMTIKYQQLATGFVNDIRKHLAANVPKLELKETK